MRNLTRKTTFALLAVALSITLCSCLQKKYGQFEVPASAHNEVNQTCQELQNLGPNVRSLIDEFNTNLKTLISSIYQPQPNFKLIDALESQLGQEVEQLKQILDAKYTTARWPALAYWQVNLNDLVDSTDPTPYGVPHIQIASIEKIVLNGEPVKSDEDIELSADANTITVQWRRELSALEYCELRDAFGLLLSVKYFDGEFNNERDIALVNQNLKGEDK